MSALASDQTLIEASFVRGVVRDSARHAIPAGGAYDLLDFLVDQPGVTYKRGGCAFQSEALSGESLLVAVMAPEYPGDPRVLAIGSTGGNRTLYDVTGDSAATGVNINDAQPTENPPLYIDAVSGGYLILTDGLGDGMGNYAEVQKVYLNSTTVEAGNLGGTPPNCRCSCVHLGLLVLANGTDPNDSDKLHTNRLWFAPTGDNTNVDQTWDTTLAWIDAPGPITGLASISGVLIVFMRGSSMRILGNVPPGTDGENMEMQPLGAVGCVDARSIVYMNGRVYFANESGVYSTGGNGYEAVTDKDDATGIASAWTTQMEGFAPALGAVVCAGVYLNTYLFLTIRHPDIDEVEGARYQWLYFEPNRSFVRLSDGVTADMYASRFAPNAELYAACGDPDDPVRLLRLSPIFDPTEDNPTDANGEDVEPLLTCRALGGVTALKAWGHARLNYRCVNGALTPLLDVASARGLQATDNQINAQLPPSDDVARVRFNVNFDSEAATLSVQQEGGSHVTQIFGFEVEVRPYDQASEGV